MAEDVIIVNETSPLGCNSRQVTTATSREDVVFIFLCDDMFLWSILVRSNIWFRFKVMSLLAGNITLLTGKWKCCY